jgi:hypothetical protein
MTVKKSAQTKKLEALLAAKKLKGSSYSHLQKLETESTPKGVLGKLKK